jgi:hypothetical protein
MVQSSNTKTSLYLIEDRSPKVITNEISTIERMAQIYDKDRKLKANQENPKPEIKRIKLQGHPINALII